MRVASVSIRPSGRTLERRKNNPFATVTPTTTSAMPTDSRVVWTIWRSTSVRLVTMRMAEMPSVT